MSAAANTIGRWLAEQGCLLADASDTFTIHRVAKAGYDEAWRWSLRQNGHLTSYGSYDKVAEVVAAIKDGTARADDTTISIDRKER